MLGIRRANRGKPGEDPAWRIALVLRTRDTAVLQIPEGKYGGRPRPFWHLAGFVGRRGESPEIEHSDPNGLLRALTCAVS